MSIAKYHCAIADCQHSNHSYAYVPLLAITKQSHYLTLSKFAMVHDPFIHAFVTQLCKTQESLGLFDSFGHSMYVPADWQHLCWQLW